ncbi:MAG: Rrf2 family transcriptional regulator [Bdellovibrionales bacterium]|nr:Rrf2 family transcriptional regulator [Bdellovibrionales bacterium]
MAANSRFAMATHILTSLALHRDKPVSSSHLASSVNTNPVVVRRILGDLQKAGLVKTTAGKTGGAALSRSPSKITLDEVYKAVDAAEIFAFNPNDPNAHCPLSCTIKSVLETVFQSADRAITKELKSRKLSDLIEMLKKRGVSNE